MHNPPSGHAFIPLHMFSSIVTAILSPYFCFSDSCSPPTPILSALFSRNNTVIDSTGEEKNTGSFYLTAIILLCLILAIYVGYENGFAFFVDTLFAEEFHSAIGKYALSVFWIIMIPSRVLAGHKAHHSYRILVSSIIAIPLITGLITLVSDDVMVLILCIPLGFFCGMIYPCVLNLAIPMSGNHKATATGMLTTFSSRTYIKTGMSRWRTWERGCLE